MRFVVAAMTAVWAFLALELALLGAISRPANAQGTVTCFQVENCGGTLTTVGSIEDCCMGPGVAFRVDSGPCETCVVFGWLEAMIRRVERGDPYPLEVGFVKGTELPDLTFSIGQGSGGNATPGIDYTLSAPINFEPEETVRIVVTLIVDQRVEPDELLQLQLEPSRRLRPNEFLLDTIEIVIESTDTVTIQFTQADYRVREDELNVPVAVEIRRSITTPITLRITPMNLTQSDFSTEVVEAASFPENRRDFNITPILITFEADDRTSYDIRTPIQIFNDETKEADEGFVVVLELISSEVPAQRINLGRNVSLCRIDDDDSIRIGFERPFYTLEEQCFRCEVPVSGRHRIPIIKEDFTEQEIEIVVQALQGDIVDINNALPSFLERRQFGDYRIGPFTNPEQNSEVFIFRPDAQSLTFTFDLHEDQLFEGTEVFVLHVVVPNTQEAGAQAVVPFENGRFPNTTIFIVDMNNLTVGFEEDFINLAVEESVDMFIVCINISNIDATVIPQFNFSLDLISIDNTASPRDYLEISASNNPLENFVNRPPPEPSVFRQCFNVSVIDDNLFEESESFNLSISLSAESVTQRVLVTPDVATVQILDDDTAVIGFEETELNVTESAGSVTVVVSVLEGGVGTPVFVALTTVNVSADAPSDYIAISDMVLVFDEASSRREVNISIIDDIVVEPDELFQVELILISTEFSQFIRIRPSVATITILNDDAVDINCGDLTDPENGQVILSGTILGSTANYSCNPGYILVGVEMRTCQTDGEWSEEPPVCTPVDCGDLTDPENGQVILSGTILGSTANYSCNPGYILVGVETRTCQTDGEWSDEPPICTPVDCGDLTDPENGQVILSGTILGSTANYSCNPGYILVGVEMRTCQTDGEWSGEPPICTPVDCGDLTDPENGQVTLSGTILGSTANYSCNRGYILVGVEMRTCQTDGEWSDEPPVCTPVDCGDLADPENGQVTLSGTILGSTANYSCNRGYILVGVKTRTCQTDGEWSDEPPICTPVVDCGNLTDPENGQVMLTNTTLGSTANYSCNPGFFLVGIQERVCQLDGEWSDDPPVCRRVTPSVNDTVVDDPLLTVPLNIRNLDEVLQTNQIVSLCYEVHGADDIYLNYVSDECVSVNVHYSELSSQPLIHFIDSIAVRAADNNGHCRNITVDLEGCAATVDNLPIDRMFSLDGISVRRYPSRVRVSVPNCASQSLVMWVFCRNATMQDPIEVESFLTLELLRFVIARGFNLNEQSHGILGQFWNIPVDIQPYNGTLVDGSPAEDHFIVTVNHPETAPRNFVGLYFQRTWELERRPCIYVGNRQGGPSGDVEEPRDSVIQGYYTDYQIDGPFATQYVFSHFNSSRCS